MLTIDDIRTVPLFAGLPDSELDRLAKSAGDVHLQAGDFAVHEGGEPALYAVLEGKIEAFKVFDSVERTLGWRTPGSVFGELPLVLSSPFVISYRAASPSRVMRVDTQHYYSIAASCREIAVKVGLLARERVGGLQEIADEPPSPRATMIGDRLDPTCRALQQFLQRNQVSFEVKAPDDFEKQSSESGERFQAADFPVLKLHDGAVLRRPSTRQLATALGLRTQPSLRDYDTVIIGGGPAGLAAAVYGASEGLRTLVLEREALGGQAGTSSRIENYLGFPNGVSGEELASRALQQAKRLGAEIVVARSVRKVEIGAHCLHLDGDDIIQARTIILATGVSWRRLDIEGCDRFAGKGIHYGASRGDSSGTHGLDIFLIGGGNSAGQAALNFANHARHVTLVVRGDSLEKNMSRYLIEQIKAKSNVSVQLNSEVSAVRGESRLSEICLRDRSRGEVSWRACGGLFVFIGADAETGWLPMEIARDQRGFVLTGDDVVKAGHWSETRDPYLLETSIPGVFACGDVRLSPVKRVASAVGEGSMAIAFVHKYLESRRG